MCLGKYRSGGKKIQNSNLKLALLYPQAYHTIENTFTLEYTTWQLVQAANCMFSIVTGINSILEINKKRKNQNAAVWLNRKQCAQYAKFTERFPIHTNFNRNRPRGNKLHIQENTSGTTCQDVGCCGFTVLAGRGQQPHSNIS